MKMIFAMALVAMTTQTYLASAQGDWTNPLNIIKEFQDGLKVIDRLSDERYGIDTDFEEKPRPPKHRIVGVIVVDIYNNLVNLFVYPSWGAFVALLVDIISYFFMPFEGGYFGAEVHHQFTRDARAYGDAGVTEDYLFKQSTNMWKERFWQFFGIFHRVSDSNN